MLELFSHSVRIGGLAFPEMFVSVLFLLWTSTTLIKLVRNTILFTGLIIGLHWSLGVHTQLNYLLGLSECGPDFDSVWGIFNCSDLIQ